VWGDTGVGKTFSARRHYGDTLYVLRLPQYGDLARWDGYRQGYHSVVLIDEFCGQIPVETLNDWTDPYPFDARTFGGVEQIRPKAFIINSNRPPEQWWGGRQTGTLQFKAFQRRYTNNGFLSFCVDRTDVLDHYDRVGQLDADDRREDELAVQRVLERDAEAQRLQEAEHAVQILDIKTEPGPALDDQPVDDEQAMIDQLFDGIDPFEFLLEEDATEDSSV